MSDTWQGDGWWQASDGKWYPPESRPGAAAPPPPGQGAGHTEKPKMSGCLKWGIIVAVVLLVGAGGCVAVVGLAADEAIDAVGDAVRENLGPADDDDYDIELTECESSEVVEQTTASGTIRNTSEKAQGFQIEVRFEDAADNLIEISSTFVDRLEIGQSGNWETSAFSQGAGTDGVSCEIDEVSYTIFDNE